jgi:hypothetical protein
MTWRELHAYRLQWAKRQAFEYNINFDTKGVPWLPEDFMGAETRTRRMLEVARTKVNVERVNVNLGKITRNTKAEEVEGLPAWARD